MAQLGDDPLCTERLLGQLSVVEAGAERHGDDTAVDFVPLRGCEDLASRALELVESA